MTTGLAIGTAILLGISPAMLAGGEPRQLEATWSSLDSRIAGRKVALVLPDGTQVEGKVRRVEPDGLLLHVTRTSNRAAQPKGERLVPRQSVSVLRLTEHGRKWRLICGIGLPAAAALVAWAATPHYLEGQAVLAAAVGGGAGAVAGSAIGGYYLGKKLDKRVVEIRIVPEDQP